MSGSVTPGINAPTTITPIATSAPATGGLINTAPGSTTTTPGTTPPGATPGAPVTGYQAQQATSSNAPAVGYTPGKFTVTPDQTVAGQIKNIIASGSPLMQQAIAGANEQMNQRGLINSSQAITAGQGALYSAAEPIASADAQAYGAAAANTTQAQNQELASEAAAQNAASLQNAQLATSTSQYNAGQANTALNTAATASNSLSQAMATIQGNKDASLAVQQITNTNQRLIQTSQAASSLYQQALSNMANILTNPNLNTTQQQQALQDQVTFMKDGLAALQGIADNQQVTSLLDFTQPGGSDSGTAGTAGSTGTTGATGGSQQPADTTPGSTGGIGDIAAAAVAAAQRGG